MESDGRGAKGFLGEKEVELCSSIEPVAYLRFVRNCKPTR